MSNVTDFVSKYKGFALECERQTGVPALFSLAQSALETGWGKAVKGNNMFGVKDTDGINGNEIEFLTTEYNKKTGAWIKIKQWFRKYQTPAASFIDHADFLVKNKRYKPAFILTKYADLFAKTVAQCGYATDPLYAEKITAVMRIIRKNLNEKN